MLIGRKNQDDGEEVVTIACTNSLGSCEPLDLRAFAGAMIRQASGTAGEVTIYMSATETGDYNEVFLEKSETAETLDFTNLAGGWTNLPAHAFAGRYFKFLAAGSITLEATRKG